MEYGNSKANDIDHIAFKNSMMMGLNKIHTVTRNMIDEFYSLTTYKKVKKGDHFLRAGEIPDSLAYNISGLFRLYYVDRDGNDFTKGFSVPGIFTMSYSAMVENRESFYSIEALKDSEILILKYKALLDLADRDIRWYAFLFKYVEKMYMMKELREKSFLLDDATKRYKDFVKKYPSLVKEIKKYHIASFLRITPETLSRIKKKI
ncbi:Crp/Fnr family transcriptional regulator [Wukongibacter baidiensis]|uniref:Crp/Fnr family transcriptional regulator n=1 Tax=Wukongibacter baidiensis TaxID=1723361 RepID=UPI003D7FD258